MKAMISSLITQMKPQSSSVATATATAGSAKKRSREVEDSDDEGSDDEARAPSPMQVVLAQAPDRREVSGKSPLAEIFYDYYYHDWKNPQNMRADKQLRSKVNSTVNFMNSLATTVHSDQLSGSNLSVTQRAELTSQRDTIISVINQPRPDQSSPQWSKWDSDLKMAAKFLTGAMKKKLASRLGSSKRKQNGTLFSFANDLEQYKKAGREGSTGRNSSSSRKTDGGSKSSVQRGSILNMLTGMLNASNNGEGSV